MSSRRRSHRASPWRLVFLAIPIAACVAVMIWLSRPPADPVRVLDEATLALNEGRLADARMLLQELHDEQPDDETVAVMLATVVGFQGESSTALKLLEELSGFDRNPALLLKAGQIAMDGYFLDKADELLARCLTLQPEDVTALRVLAMLRTTVMDSAAARPLFVELDRLGQLTAQDVLTIIMADRIRSDVDENMKHLRGALKMEPGSARSIAALVDNFLTLGQATEAESFLREALRLSVTDHWRIDLARASLFLAQDKREEAAKIVSRLPQAADATERVWLLRGKVLEQLGNHRAALDCYLNAEALDPLDPEPPYLIARATEKSAASPDQNQLAKMRERAARLQAISVETSALLNLESEAEAIERLAKLSGLLIGVGATREAAVILKWLTDEGYSFNTMKEPQAALESQSNPSPRVLSTLPMKALRPVSASEFDSDSAKPAPMEFQSLAGQLRQPVFSDVTQQLGVAFEYVCPESNRTEVLASLGGGVACFDLDHDGHVDLFFPQGGHAPEQRVAGSDLGACLRRQQQVFADVATVAGFSAGDYSHGAAVSDFNNDGFDDLLITSFGINQFWINLGDGTFQQADELCLSMLSEWSSSAVFADLDDDGDDDLYVVHYLDDLCPEIKIGDCGPRTLNACQDRLYENIGDGGFREITETAGIVANGGKGLGAVAADFNQDGRLDVFVGNDATENFLWSNESDHSGIKLNNIAIQSGVAVGSDGRPQACMGIAIADVDENSFPDLFVSNFEFETNTFYSNRGEFQFVDQGRVMGLEEGSYALMGWGTQFFQLDDDMKPDLALLNGFLDARPLRPQLYLQSSEGFRDVSEIAGPWFQHPWSARGLAVCDLNNDGVQDLVATMRSGTPALLQSNQSSAKRFTLVLSGRTCSRVATGARVTVTSAGRTVTQELFAGGGYLCANQLMLSLPCSSERVVESIRIEWPDRHSDEWQNVTVAARMIAVESSAASSAQLLSLP